MGLRNGLILFFRSNWLDWLIGKVSLGKVVQVFVIFLRVRLGVGCFGLLTRIKLLLHKLILSLLPLPSPLLLLPNCLLFSPNFNLQSILTPFLLPFLIPPFPPLLFLPLLKVVTLCRLPS